MIEAALREHLGLDFLISLADHSQSLIVTGDSDLLGLAPRLPAVTPAAFLGPIEV